MASNWILKELKICRRNILFPAAQVPLKVTPFVFEYRLVSEKGMTDKRHARLEFKVGCLKVEEGGRLREMKDSMHDLYVAINTHYDNVRHDLGEASTNNILSYDYQLEMRGFLGQPQLENALTGMDLVIIPTGVPRKPGMTRDDLFKINAGIVKTLCEGVAKCCPRAIMNLISNPVNSMVPIAVKVFKKADTNDLKLLLGVMTLDVVRANTFVVKPPCSFTSEEIAHLSERI